MTQDDRARVPSDVPVAARVLLAPKAALVVCVNETAADAVRTITVDGVTLRVPVHASGARLALLERPDGRVVCATPGSAIRRSDP